MNTSSKAILIIASVVAVHFLAGTLILLQPGCKSSVAKQPPAPAAAADVTAIPAPAPTALQPPTRPVTPIPVANLGSEPLTPDNTAINPPLVGPPAAPTVTYVVKARDNPYTIARDTGVPLNALLAANNLTPTTVVRPGQELKIPTQAAATPGPSAPGPSLSTGAKTYTVASGDNLGTIARRQGTTVAALRSANNLTSDNIRAGQKLILPEAGVTGATAGTSTSITATASALSADGGTYTVQPNDNPETIAKKFNVKSADLMRVNNITNPKALQVGQKLKLPPGASGAAPAAATPPPPAPSSSTLFPPTSPAPAGTGNTDNPPVVPVTGPN